MVRPGHLTLKLGCEMYVRFFFFRFDIYLYDKHLNDICYGLNYVPPPPKIMLKS